MKIPFALSLVSSVKPDTSYSWPLLVLMGTWLRQFWKNCTRQFSGLNLAQLPIVSILHVCTTDVYNVNLRITISFEKTDDDASIMGGAKVEAISTMHPAGPRTHRRRKKIVKGAVILGTIQVYT